MPRSGVRIVGAVVIVAMVWSMGTACSRRPTEVRPPERTAWQKIMDLTGPNGEVSTQMAVQAFALTIGPLPGVSVPSGPPGPVESGTPATEWVLGHWEDLTTEQRREVDAYLGLGLPLTGGGLGGGVGRAVPAAPLRPTEVPFVTCDRSQKIPASSAGEAGQAMVGALVPLIESRLGVQLNVRLVVCLASGDLPATTGRPGYARMTTMATASVLHRDNSLECRITLYQSGQQMPDARRRHALLHELMHCFMTRMAATPTFPIPPFPPWVSEGVSEWVADQISDNGSTFWPDYLTRPESALVGRSYDAVGFFSHLQDVHREVWSLIPNIVRESVRASRTDSEAAFAAAIAPNPTAVLDTLPSSWLRQRNRGAPLPSGGGPWDITGVGIPADSPVHPHLGPVQNDGPDVSVTANAWASELAETDIRADVVTVSAAGGSKEVHGRFGPGATGDYPLADAMSRVFCAKRGGCACKDGPGPATFTNIDPGLAYVAVTGGTVPAGVLLHGSSLSAFCKKPAKTTFTRPDPCRVITREEVSRIAGQPFDECRAGAGGAANDYFFSTESATGMFLWYDPAAGPIGVTTAVNLFSYDLGGDAATKFVAGCQKLPAYGNGSTGKVPNLGDDNCYLQAAVVVLLVRRANIALIVIVETLDASVDKATQVATTVLNRLT